MINIGSKAGCSAGGGSTGIFSDAVFTIQNSADDTKQAKFDASNITSGQTRVFDFPDLSGTLALISDILTRQATSEKDQVNGYAGLDASGKINSSQIPQIAISDFLGNFTDTTNALADAGVQASHRGDWFTVDTNGGESWVVTTDNPTLIGDIAKLATPTPAVTSVFGRIGTVTAQNNDYTWAQIDKSTSSLADITTRSASDLTSGNLDYTRMPTGGGTWAVGGALTITSTNLTILGYATPLTSVDSNGNNDGILVTKGYVDDAVAGFDTFLELTDTISSYNSGRILFEGVSAVTDSANLTFDGSNLTAPRVDTDVLQTASILFTSGTLSSDNFLKISKVEASVPQNSGSSGGDVWLNAQDSGGAVIGGAGGDIYLKPGDGLDLADSGSVHIHSGGAIRTTIGVSSFIVNPANEAFDFIIKADDGTEAYKYDANALTHTFTDSVLFDELTNDNGLVFTDANGKLENSTKLTYDGTNFVIDGAGFRFNETADNFDFNIYRRSLLGGGLAWSFDAGQDEIRIYVDTIFNRGNGDVDFIIRADDGTDAYKYDAGNEEHTFTDDVTFSALAGTANSILLTDANGKLVDSTATITTAPTGGSVLNLQAYSSDPAVGDRVSGDAWILNSGGIFLKYWDGSTLYDVELT